ncbi:ATP-binding protein [bacterium 1xD8-48]|nr:ATP-binding protein [bacterium 1xD8-48]
MVNTICYFFSFLVEAIILWQYSSHLFSAKHSPKRGLAVLCGLYFILFCVSLSEFIWLNILLYFLLNFIFFMTQCYLNWYTAVFHSSILTAVMTMSELMVYGITKRFAPHFLDNGREFYHLLFFSVFSKLIFFVVTYILMHLMQNPKKNTEKYDKSVFLPVFIPLTSIFIMFTFISIGESVSLPSSLDWMVVVSAVFLLTANLLMFEVNQYHQKKNMEFTEMQLLLQKEADSAQYYKMLNEQKEYVKISAYIRQLALSSDLKESSRLCEHEMLNSILCRYMKQCADSHIAFHVDIRSGTTDFIADNDLTSLFCNLLDNSVKAAEGIPESFIEISTGKKAKTPFTVLTVINSCRTNPFITKNGSPTINIPHSHKHGFGLKSIRKIVDKYNGNMQIYYNSDTLTFHAIITLKQQGL